jgi:hypothetical protein
MRGLALRIVHVLRILAGISHILFLLAAAILLESYARADIVSEFGMGVKLSNTSYLLTPTCHTASVIEPGWPANPRPYPQVFSCGGDNPTFIGWPIAWEREFLNGALRFRGGWFHYSNWFDGGRDRETHMDTAQANLTVNWSQWKRNRQTRSR